MNREEGAIRLPRWAWAILALSVIGIMLIPSSGSTTTVAPASSTSDSGECARARQNLAAAQARLDKRVREITGDVFRGFDWEHATEAEYDKMKATADKVANDLTKALQNSVKELKARVDAACPKPTTTIVTTTTTTVVPPTSAPSTTTSLASCPPDAFPACASP